MPHSRPWPIPPAGGDTIHLITDTHFGYRPWSYEEGDHMLADIRDGLIPPVSAMVHAGDITDDGYPEQDKYAVPWLSSAAKGRPSMVVPGNHCLRTRTPNTREAWEKAYGRPGNSVLELDEHLLVGFAADTQSHDFTTGADSGWQLPDATWQWLHSVCGSATKPVILVNHYPLWEMGVASVNAVQPADRMTELIATHPNVVGMLCGHMHWEVGDPRLVKAVTVGPRSVFPIVLGVSPMLSLSGLSRDQSAQIPSTSMYVTLREDSWEVRYRLHGPHAWGGPDGQRVTRLNVRDGAVAHAYG